MTNGRRATRPATGWEAPTRLLHQGEVVLFEPEGGGPSIEFRFDDLPVSPSLRRAFATAFANLSGPDGTQRARTTVNTTHASVRQFARLLAELPTPPTEPSGLRPAHLAGMRLSSPHLYRKLRPLLRVMPTRSPEIAAALEIQQFRRYKQLSSLPRSDYNLVMSAARRDLRLATDRIRRNRDHLQRWSAGEFAPESRDAAIGRMLSQLAKTGDLPRGDYIRPDSLRPSVTPWVLELGNVAELSSSLFLTWREAVSAAVLLVGMTGHNFSGINNLTADHTRADGCDSLPSTGTAIVELDKPRRGRNARFMTAPLVDLPDDVLESGLTGDVRGLNTPFGVYTTLVDLGEDSRRLSGSSRLFLYLATRGGGIGRHWATVDEHGGVLSEWTRANGFQRAEAPEGPVQLTWPKLRLTYLTLHQRGVAHNDETLANQYLLRDRQNYEEYQRVVANVLTEQEAKARQSQTLRVLSEEETALVGADPARLAESIDVAVPILEKLLDGELDTALAGCVDELQSPYSPAGSACSASFLLCLQCSNARATPAHLPVQAFTLRRIEELRAELVPHRWAEKFAGVAAQLQDLLGRYSDERITAALAAITPDQRSLVDRLLSGKLDHR